MTASREKRMSAPSVHTTEAFRAAFSEGAKQE
jgi:hypothetical protein